MVPASGWSPACDDSPAQLRVDRVGWFTGGASELAEISGWLGMGDWITGRGNKEWKIEDDGKDEDVVGVGAPPFSGGSLAETTDSAGDGLSTFLQESRSACEPRSEHLDIPPGISFRHPAPARGHRDSSANLAPAL